MLYVLHTRKESAARRADANEFPASFQFFGVIFLGVIIKQGNWLQGCLLWAHPTAMCRCKILQTLYAPVSPRVVEGERMRMSTEPTFGVHTQLPKSSLPLLTRHHIDLTGRSHTLVVFAEMSIKRVKVRKESILTLTLNTGVFCVRAIDANDGFLKRVVHPVKSPLLVGRRGTKAGKDRAVRALPQVLHASVKVFVEGQTEGAQRVVCGGDGPRLVEKRHDLIERSVPRA
jgi:hypothetical protein